MLADKKIVVPTNLINLAKKTSLIPVGIVCAHHESTMISAKQANELSLIEPIFIGQKQSITEEANKLNWNIGKFEIFEENNDQDAAALGTGTNLEDIQPSGHVLGQKTQRMKNRTGGPQSL